MEEEYQALKTFLQTGQEPVDFTKNKKYKRASKNFTQKVTLFEAGR